MSKLRCSNLQRICVLTLLVLLLAGCAIIPAPTRSARVGGGDALGSCADFFADLDRRAAHAQVLDSGTFRVEGYPYLRVNRFLSSFGKEVGDQAAFAAWVDQMQALDQNARKYEIANLPHATGSIPGIVFAPCFPILQPSPRTRLKCKMSHKAQGLTRSRSRPLRSNMHLIFSG